MVTEDTSIAFPPPPPPEEFQPPPPPPATTKYPMVIAVPPLPIGGRKVLLDTLLFDTISVVIKIQIQIM
jgi:hypothetical protein